MLALGSGASAVRAQVAPPDSAAVIDAPPIIVSILGFDVPLAEVPWSVTRVEGATLRRGPRLGLDEALAGIPGVQADNRYNDAVGERLMIRGFGARAQFGVRGIRVLVDGVPATLADGQTVLSVIDPGTIAVVEVLRGPAAALYGNAAGGVVRFETAPPPEAPGRAHEVKALGGRFGLRRVEAGTGARGERAAWRFHVARLVYGGHRAFSRAENTFVSGRFQTVAAGGDIDATAHLVDYDANSPGSLSAALIAEDPRQAFAGNINQMTGERGRQAQMGAVWRRRTPSGEVELSGYLLGRSIDNPIPPAIIDLSRIASGFSARYHVGSRAGRGVRGSLGITVDAQRDDRRNFANDGGERGAVTLAQDERVTAAGAYGQVTIPIGARIEIVGAVRYDRFAFGIDDRLVGADEPDDSGTRTLDAVSPSIGLALHPARAWTVFVNASTAFETPTTSELANRPDGAGGFNPDLGPQETVSVEAGVRRGGRRLRFEAAAYRARVDDALIPFQVETRPERDFFRNAGSVRHTGFEIALDVRHRAAYGSASYAWTRVRFDDFDAGGTSFDGLDVPGVAAHRAEFRIGLDSPHAWYADLGARAVARYAVNDANTAFAPGYAVLDVRAGHAQLPAGGVDIAPFIGVRNVLDADYVSSVVINAFGARYFEPGPGRALYAGVTVRP